MSSLLEGAKRLVSRGSDLGDRVEGLGQAGRGRSRPARRPCRRRRRGRGRPGSPTRLGLTADHTVVALAGATGSGKSSTFNALAGVELSSVGVRRPTTSWATACVWGKEGADELLEYLDIAPRHQVMRDSLLDLGKEDSALQGVVLLDLPDHDSTEVSHHLEVDRLIELADLMVWVLDPQKYADAAVHDRYLAPLATHKDVHAGRAQPHRRGAGRPARVDDGDIRRLVDADGLIGVPVLATSARTGEGIDELRDEIARRVKAKKVTRARLEADVRQAASAPAGGQRHQHATRSCRRSGSPPSMTPSPWLPACRPSSTPSSRPPGCARTGRPAGRSPPGCPGCVPTPSSACTSTSARTASSTPAAAARPSRPRPRSSAPPSTARCAPSPTRCPRPLARPWAESVRRASVSRLPDLNDRLDSALAATDLDAGRIPVWAGLVRVLQWLLLLAALAGAVWLGVLATDRYLGVSEPSTPDVAGFPVPTVMLLGGIVLGIVLSLRVPAPGLGDRALAGALGRPSAAVGDRRGGRRARGRAGAGRAGGVRPGA